MPDDIVPFRETGPHAPRDVQAIQVNGIVVASVTVEDPVKGRCDELLFLFAVNGKPITQLVCRLDDAALASLPGLVADAVASTQRHRVTAKEGTHPADDVAERIEKARCPGCGEKLHGDVALRGGCLACYPDLPPDPAQPIGDDA